MGIKELWSALEPYSERKPLYELEGKVVAIDLAGWVCESLCVVDYVVQPRFYLRNLFFRTCYLLLSGVTPVFVLEGDAPPLKYGVICKRNEMLFRGARPRQQPSQQNRRIKKPDKGRSRFNYVLKQCEELLTSIGLQCIQGPGEAEQFCAFLNEDKMVDGVISQDSDCFAYGARRVYRNFSVSTQGASTAQGGAVDVYDMEKIQKSMDFGRNKMVVLALLCGCDYYPDGVSGVGKEAAMKFINQYSEAEILTRVKSWRSMIDKYTSLELKVDNKSFCTHCGHTGRVQNHTKNGCSECRMDPGCDASVWKEQRLVIKSELQIRKKAMSNPDFPPQPIIDEFLNRPVNLPKLDLSWKQPSVVKFLKFMSHLLQWEEIYCFQKFLPLLTRWQLFHYESGSMNLPLKGNVSPDYIKKKRTPKGIASYEIIWKDDRKCFTGLIPEEQITTFTEQNSGLEPLWSTVEPIDLVQKAYPNLVSCYLDSLNANRKKSSKAASKIIKKSTETYPKKLPRLRDIDGNNEINGPEKLIKPRKVKSKKNNGKSNLIDNYFKKNKILPPILPQSPKRPQVTQSPQIKTCPTPLRRNEFSFDLNNSDDDFHDISDIILGIVSNSPTTKDICGKPLHYDIVHNQLEPFKGENENGDTDSHEKNYLIKRKPLTNRTNTPTTSRAMNSFFAKRSSSRNIDDPTNSSTPIITAFLKRNAINVNASSPTTSLQNASFESITSKQLNDDKNVSYFFGDITSENDVFEKLIDFHNMADEVNAYDYDDAGCNHDQEINDSPPMQRNETFDLDNYVPVGAKLRKRLES